MFEQKIELGVSDWMPENRLWTAVLASAVSEWFSENQRLRREAEEFLFGDEEDFPFICSAAGYQPSRVRNRLNAYRSRATRSELPASIKVRQSKTSRAEEMPAPESYSAQAGSESERANAHAA